MRRSIGPLIVIGVILSSAGAIGAYLYIREHRIQTNEAAALEAIKSLCTAQSDFRSNDRDVNKVTDYWTGDVAGLYRHGLIPRELAEADARPLTPLVPEPVPYQGYLFTALDADDAAGKDYRLDTDGSSGSVHHPSRFGFCAYPASPGNSGKTTFIINEGNTVIRLNVDGTPVHRWPRERDEHLRPMDMEE